MNTAPRRALLLAALAAMRVKTNAPELAILHAWPDSWFGLGLVVVGMQRHGYDLTLTHDRSGWRATFLHRSHVLYPWVGRSCGVPWGESGGATDVTASASGAVTTAALQRQMTSAIPIQQHLGEEVEGLDLSMDSVSNATQPGQLLGVLGRYSYRLAGVRPALGVNPA